MEIDLFCLIPRSNLGDHGGCNIYFWFIMVQVVEKKLPLSRTAEYCGGTP